MDNSKIELNCTNDSINRLTELLSSQNCSYGLVNRTELLNTIYDLLLANEL
jgi:hypothetical protein